jgi:hypothetical protein
MEKVYCPSQKMQLLKGRIKFLSCLGKEKLKD